MPWYTYAATLNCHYDENRIFPIEAILKHKQVACMRRKMLFLFVPEIFKFLKYAKWYRHTLNQILIKHDEKGYLSQFASEMFDSLQ